MRSKIAKPVKMVTFLVSDDNGQPYAFSVRLSNTRDEIRRSLKLGYTEITISR